MLSNLQGLTEYVDSLNGADPVDAAKIYTLVVNLGLDRPAARYAIVGREERACAVKLIDAGLSGANESAGDRVDLLLEAYLHFGPISLPQYQIASVRLATIWARNRRLDPRAKRLYAFALPHLNPSGDAYEWISEQIA